MTTAHEAGKRHKRTFRLPSLRRSSRTNTSPTTTTLPFTDDFTRDDGPLGNGWTDYSTVYPDQYAILSVIDGELSVDRTTGADFPANGIGFAGRQTHTKDVTITTVSTDNTDPHSREYGPLARIHAVDGDTEVGFGLWPSNLGGVGAALFGAIGNPPTAFQVFAVSPYSWSTSPRTTMMTVRGGLITAASIDATPLTMLEIERATVTPTGTTIDAVSLPHNAHASSTTHGFAVDVHLAESGTDIDIGDSITIEAAEPLDNIPRLIGGINANMTVAAGDSISVTAPEGTRAGDLLVAVAYLNNASVTTVTSNSSAFTAAGTTDTGQGRYRLFTRTATSSDAGATFQFTVNGAGSVIRIVILAFSNASGIEGYTAGNSHGSGGTDNLPSVTTLGPNRKLVGVIAQEAAANITTRPSTWTTHREDEAASSSMWIGSLFQAAAGASTQRAYEWDTSAQGGSFAFAVKP